MKTSTHKEFIICDLDNTLYDWVHYFVKSFYAMVDAVVELTGCDREQLLDDFRSVHRKYHDSEHPFALLETKTIRRLFAGQSAKDVAAELDPALFAFNRSRKRYLFVYPGVYESLRQIRTAGVRIVGHTESNLFAAVDRLTRLELEVFFDRVYCRKRAPTQHPNPKAMSNWLNRHSLDKFFELPDNQRKPNAKILREICSREDVRICDAAYVGDSVARDILMAKQAGMYAIWAKYGTVHTLGEYERLVRITHWTARDVKREMQLQEKAKDIEADATLKESFAEIVDVLQVAK